MLKGDVRQLGGPSAQGLQGNVDPRQEKAPLIGPAFGDDPDGSGRPHVDGDDGRREFLQRRHSIRHDIGPYLGLDRQTDVQAGLHAGADNHGRLAQKAGEGLFHHEIQRRDNTAQDSPGDILITEMIQGKEVHQVDADLVRGLPAVRVQRGQKAKGFVLVEKAHGGIRVAYINGKQHGKRSFRSGSCTFFII